MRGVVARRRVGVFVCLYGWGPVGTVSRISLLLLRVWVVEWAGVEAGVFVMEPSDEYC